MEPHALEAAALFMRAGGPCARNERTVHPPQEKEHANINEVASLLYGRVLNAIRINFYSLSRFTKRDEAFEKHFDRLRQTSFP
jgi:hypothetical protein